MTELKKAIDRMKDISDDWPADGWIERHLDAADFHLILDAAIWFEEGGTMTTNALQRLAKRRAVSR